MIRHCYLVTGVLDNECPFAAYCIADTLEESLDICRIFNDNDSGIHLHPQSSLLVKQVPKDMNKCVFSIMTCDTEHYKIGGNKDE